jgi:pyruvate kinase
LTPVPETYYRLPMVWGVTPLQTALGEQTDAILAAGEDMLLERGMVRRGEMVVIVSGAMPLPGATDLIKIHKIAGR